ncbi:YafY family protein [Rhodococcus sp. G-MC3]|uniref:helix-turn-helix transcriptional regulator n=1 Tax=Rhodococcus sp. G-MC3 TaxID=3046209 RepID=UPI0024BBB303|nr:YafY family protein [Rhodococcus sp. G-MC3]MDJ0392882.1 YafY family protein [Rhodococcus sp. G-MC3]
MRADRLLSLVLLLRNRGRMSASTLAKELEVSERTVLRDIDALSTSGFPVYAERGRNGGFALMPGFTTDLTGLSIAEAKALLTGEASESLGMAADFASAMRKVAASMPDEQRRAATTVADRVLVRPEGWYADPAPDEHLAAVQQAVFVGLRLRISYAGRGRDVTERTIDPIGLVYAAGRWYLMATHRGKDRTYRLSRIRAVVQLDEPAHRSSVVDLAALWAGRRERFRSTIELVPVVISVSLGRRDELAAAAIRVIDEKTVDSHIVMTVVLGDVGHVAWLAFMFGDDVEVLGPEEVRRAVADRARVLAARHS